LLKSGGENDETATVRLPGRKTPSWRGKIKFPVEFHASGKAERSNPLIERSGLRMPARKYLADIVERESSVVEAKIVT
jgi:hypothetical protein